MKKEEPRRGIEEGPKNHHRGGSTAKDIKRVTFEMIEYGDDTPTGVRYA